MGCARLGGFIVSEGSMAFGSWLLSSGAPMLAAMSSNRTTAPINAPRLRNVRRKMRRVGDSLRPARAPGKEPGFETVGATVREVI